MPMHDSIETEAICRRIRVEYKLTHQPDKKDTYAARD